MQQDEIIFEGKRYIVVDAAAKESGRTREYLMTQCRLGKLEGRRIGRVWYIDHASLIAFVDDQQRALERHYLKLSEERAEEYNAHQLVSAIEHTPEKDQTEISPTASEPLVRENVPVAPPRHIMSFFSAEGAVLILLMMFISSAGLLSWYARSGDGFTVFGGTPILEKLSGIFSFSRNDPSPPGTPPHQEGFGQQTINNNEYNTTNVYDTSTTNNNNYNSYLSTTKVEGINEGVLSARIKALDDTLTERMYSLVSANTTNITQAYQTLGAVARGDNFNDIKVTDSAWTEGSITDATISGGTITGATSISAGSLTLSNPLGVSSGGTGVGSYAIGDILYASSTDTLAKLPAGTSGQLLSITNGVPSWSSLAGSGSIGVWATTSDSLAIYTVDSSDVVLIGTSATTTTGNLFEVLGNSLFRGTLTSYNTVTASSFTATSTSVTSQFINASSTALSALDYLAVGRTATTTIRGNTSTSTFSGPIASVSGNLELGGFTSSDNLILNRYGGNVGVGTTSPFAKLAVHAFSGETNQTLFAAASSTSSATTTLFSISNTGTTTLGRFGTCSGANALTTDSSGNIVCGAHSGTGDGVGEWFVANTFGTSASVSTSTLTGFTQGLYSLASTTIGNGTATGGLTVSGTATSTNLRVTALTSGRVPYITTGSQFTDSANLTFDGTTLTANTLALTTDLAVTEGGTGASTLTDGGILLGSGTGAITTMAVLANGSIVVGDGTTDPVALAAFTSSTGDLIHEAGGLEADVSAYSSILTITGGATTAYAGTSCSNQFVRSLSALGAATCATVSLTADVTGDLPFANLAQVSANSVLGNITAGTADATSVATSSLFTWTGTGNVVRAISPTFTGILIAGDTLIAGTLSLSGTAANIALGSNFLSGDGGDEGIAVDSDGNVTVSGAITEAGSAVLSAANIDTCAEFILLVASIGTCGSTVFSVSPTLTGTLTAAAADFSDLLTFTSGLGYTTSGIPSIFRGTSGTGGSAHSIIFATGVDFNFILDSNNNPTAADFGIYNHATSSTPIFQVDDSGQIGVNDSTPDFTFEVVSSIGSGYFGVTNSTDGDIFIINSTGQVGIGDASPSQLLDIDGTNPQILTEESTTEFFRAGVGETAATSVIGWDDSDSLELGVYSSPTDTTISSLMTILSTGNVGIGTTTPATKLTVYKGVNGTLESQLLRLHRFENFATGHASDYKNYLGLNFDAS